MTESIRQFSFFEHLAELRSHLVKSLAAWAIGSVVAYNFVDVFLRWLVKPVGHLVFTSPADAFNARMQLTFVGGAFVASPVILYHFWRFVAEALTLKERRTIAVFGPLSLLCFVLGVSFSYFVFIPMSASFLLSFSSDILVPMITVNEYISFVASLLLAGGVVFELPLVLMFLTKIGIATPEFLRQKRRYAIVLILIVSAVITPPDVVSQIVMAAPLLILYEVGIVVCQVVSRNKKF